MFFLIINLKKIKLIKAFLKKLSKYFVNFNLSLQGYDKVDGNLRNKKKFFYKNLEFCFFFIRENKPDLIVFYTWPHNSFDYTLYIIAKKILKIPVFFIDAHEHLNKFYHIIGTDLENLHMPIMKTIYLIIKKNRDVPKYYNWVKKGQINFIKKIY